MKRLCFLILVITIISVNNNYAQDQSLWKFGVKAGLNYSDSNFFADGNFLTNRVESSSSFYVGITSYRELDDRFGLQFELLYSEFKFLDHLEVSMLGNYKFLNGKLRAVLGFKIVNVLTNDFDRDDIDSWNLGIEYGVEIPILKNFYGEAKYVWFIRNISDDKIGIFSTEPKNLSAFRLGLAYHFN